MDGEFSSYEILFYPKNHLDKSSLLHKTVIPEGKRPSFIDCNDFFLIVFTTDSIFFQYRITPLFKTGSEISSIKLDLIQQISMNEITLSVPPLSITLLPSIPLDLKTRTSTSCLMLSASGQLILCAIEDNKQVVLANNVEQYWIANYISTSASSENTTDVKSDGSTELENTLWAYGQDGLQVWFPFFTESIHLQEQFLNQQTRSKGSITASSNAGSSSSKLMSREKSLEFDLEVYPIGFIPELGVIIGLTQEVSLLNNSSYVSIRSVSNSISSQPRNGNLISVYFPSFDFKIKVFVIFILINGNRLTHFYIQFYGTF